MSDLSDLSPESRALLGLEGPLDEPSPAELDVRRDAIFRTLGIAPPAALPVAPDVPTAPSVSTPVQPPVSPPAAVAPLPSAPAWTAGMKLALGFAAVGVLAAGVWLLLPQAEETRTADDPGTQTVNAGGDVPDAPITTPVAPDREATLEPSAPPEVTPEGTPQLPTREPSAPRGERQATPGVTPELPAQLELPTPPEPQVTEATPDELTPDPLSEESMLIAAGEAQLRAGQAANALTLFDRALARHPRGSLRVEALAGRALALCRSGRMDAGVREAERFLASYPRSPSAPRIREACGVAP